MTIWSAGRRNLAVGWLLPELAGGRAVRAFAARILVLALAIALSAVIALIVLLYARWPIASTIVIACLFFLALSLRVYIRRIRAIPDSTVRIVGATSTFVAAVLVVLTTAAGILTANAEDRARPYIVALLLVAAAATTLFSIYQMHRSLAVATDLTRIAMRSTIAATFSRELREASVAFGTAEVSATAETVQGVERAVISGVLKAINTLCGHDSGVDNRTRSAFYRLVAPGTLQRIVWEGRRDPSPPREYFVAARNINDRGVLEIAKGGTALLVRDLSSAPPDYFADYPGRRYHSTITVPVRYGRKRYGILTVDSDRPNSLTGIDVAYMLILSAKLGNELAKIEMESHDTRESLGREAGRDMAGEDEPLRPANVLTVPLLSEHELDLIAGTMSREEYVSSVGQSAAAPYARATGRWPTHRLLRAGAG